MYPVSAAYKAAIKDSVVEDKIQGTITTKDGTVLEISDENIFQGSLYFTEQIVSGSDIDIGSVCASEISVSLTTDIIENPYMLDGARIALQYGLKTGPDAWEYVPLGFFYVTEITRSRDAVDLKALDGLILFDTDLTGVTTSGTLHSIALSCCLKAGVTLASDGADWANNETVYTLPEESKIDTCRDLLMWVCQLAGGYARMNRLGQLEINTPNGMPVRTISLDERYRTTVSDFTLTITKVSMTVDGVEFVQGADDGKIMELDENPLLLDKTDAQRITTLANILGKLISVQYVPGSVDFIGDPALQAGDYVTISNPRGLSRSHYIQPFLPLEERDDVTLLITKTTWRYRGSHTITADGESTMLRGEYSQDKKAVAAIAAETKKALELAAQTSQAAQLLNNAIGGNVLIRENGSTNEILIMDNPDPNAATKIWRWNIAGLGYSDNVTGADNPLREYSVAITMDGSINAAFVRTGILISQNGSSWINLNDGSFSFGDGGFYWNGETGGIHTKKGYTFSDDGLIIDSNASQTKSLVDEAGMEVIDKSGSTEKTLFYAGIDAEGRATVDTEFINVKTYIKIGDNSRIQNYSTGRTGVFYVGG